ncbi:hypothetical protein G7051_17495 [Dysgonomonas sp. HDW5B]|uniref:hypothetical protein n=1 Tax=Dysgonomonas sp. HDW5B TaxID=2714927 RepID=UPI001407A0B3|nr:hypothetical protein [Dysgonomonas sp. HDW5B]QIK56055.1 hypothetical protein G7051_17495 [Dysgonomonas sp. HDW5B]
MQLNNLKKQDRSSKLGALKYRMYVAKMQSVAVEDYPKPMGVRIMSNVLLPGEVFKFIDSKVNTIKPNVAPGESPFNGVITLSPTIEGISEETLAWAYDNVGEDFVVVYERCSDGKRFIAGDPCSGGLKFAYTAIGDLDGGISGIASTFTGGECPNPIYFYEGPLPLAEADIIAADAATFALTDNFQYQLSANTLTTILSNITNVTDSDTGRIIEIIGAGNTNSTKIIPSDSFILNRGLDFVATAGSRISFIITKTGSGYAFFEIFRA